MLTFLKIFLISLLLYLAYQDFSRREISWWLLPLSLFSTLTIQWGDLQMESWLLNSGVNFCFVAINLILVTFYFSVKKRKWVNIIDRQIAWGDILFWLVCVLTFDLINFLLFSLISLITALFVAVFFILAGSKHKTIPLAGIMALLMSFLVSFDLFFGKNLLRAGDWWQNYWLR
jgi:Flp pilus assembly protein protease CpaA